MRWRCSRSWACHSRRPRTNGPRRESLPPQPSQALTRPRCRNATEITDREIQAEGKVHDAKEKPLQPVRPLARIPASVRAVPNLLQRVGAVRDDSRRKEGELVMKVVLGAGGWVLALRT